MKRALIASSLALLIASTGLAPVHAGEGHDHGDAPAAPSANGPQRQPDGSVFLPKPAQRQLGVRTMVTEEAELPRSVEQLTQLVGRVALKELVRETTDVIERLCIEAALELTGDNRASAAEMLGLSRQSLYSKLRRFGLGDLDGDVDDEDES